MLRVPFGIFKLPVVPEIYSKGTKKSSSFIHLFTYSTISLSPPYSPMVRAREMNKIGFSNTHFSINIKMLI